MDSHRWKSLLLLLLTLIPFYSTELPPEFGRCWINHYDTKLDKKYMQFYLNDGKEFPYTSGMRYEGHSCLTNVNCPKDETNIAYKDWGNQFLVWAPTKINISNCDQVTTRLRVNFFEDNYACRPIIIHRRHLHTRLLPNSKAEVEIKNSGTSIEITSIDKNVDWSPLSNCGLYYVVFQIVDEKYGFTVARQESVLLRNVAATVRFDDLEPSTTYTVRVIYELREIDDFEDYDTKLNSAEVWSDTISTSAIKDFDSSMVDWRKYGWDSRFFSQALCPPILYTALFYPNAQSSFQSWELKSVIIKSHLLKDYFPPVPAERVPLETCLNRNIPLYACYLALNFNALRFVSQTSEDMESFNIAFGQNKGNSKKCYRRFEMINNKCFGENTKKQENTKLFERCKAIALEEPYTDAAMSKLINGYKYAKGAEDICPNACSARNEESLKNALDPEISNTVEQLYYGGIYSHKKRKYPCDMLHLKNQRCLLHEATYGKVTRHAELAFKCYCDFRKHDYTYWNHHLNYCVHHVSWVAKALYATRKTPISIVYPNGYTAHLACNGKGTESIIPIRLLQYADKIKFHNMLGETNGQHCLCKPGYGGTNCDEPADNCKLPIRITNLADTYPEFECKTVQGGICASYPSINYFTCKCPIGYRLGYLKDNMGRKYGETCILVQTHKNATEVARKPRAANNAAGDLASEIKEEQYKLSACKAENCVHGQCVSTAASDVSYKPISIKNRITQYCLCDQGWIGQFCSVPDIYSEGWEPWSRWSFCVPGETEPHEFIPRHRWRSRICTDTRNMVCQYGAKEIDRRICRPRVASRYMGLEPDTGVPLFKHPSYTRYAEEFAEMIISYQEVYKSVILSLSCATVLTTAILFLKVFIMRKFMNSQQLSKINLGTYSAEQSLLRTKLSFKDLNERTKKNKIF